MLRQRPVLAPGASRTQRNGTAQDGPSTAAAKQGMASAAPAAQVPATGRWAVAGSTGRTQRAPPRQTAMEPSGSRLQGSPTLANLRCSQSILVRLQARLRSASQSEAIRRLASQGALCRDQGLAGPQHGGADTSKAGVAGGHSRSATRLRELRGRGRRLRWGTGGGAGDHVHLAGQAARAIGVLVARSSDAEAISAPPADLDCGAIAVVGQALVAGHARPAVCDQPHAQGRAGRGGQGDARQEVLAGLDLQRPGAALDPSGRLGGVLSSGVV